MSRFAAEIQDAAYGRPADDIEICLDRADGRGWIAMKRARTGWAGHVDDWDHATLERGLYRIVLDTSSYFADLGLSAAYPEIQVFFRIQNGFELCRILVVLSPYSHSTHFYVSTTP
jgi:5-hydroxyisourate hydrolase